MSFFTASSAETNLGFDSDVCCQFEFWFQPLLQATALEPCTGFGPAQIFLGERSQVGFVINVHFQASIAANHNLRTSALGLRTMFRKTAGAEMRRKQRRRRAQNGVRPRA